MIPPHRFSSPPYIQPVKRSRRFSVPDACPAKRIVQMRAKPRVSEGFSGKIVSQKNNFASFVAKLSIRSMIYIGINT